MKQRKYKESYRVVRRVDPRTGRERSAAEYVGSYYRLPGDGPSAAGRALRLLPWLIAYWAAAAVYLNTAQVTSRCMYALVPLLFSLFPGIYALMGLYRLLRAPGRLTVVQKENGPGRLLRSAVGGTVCAGIGAVGCAIFLTKNRLWGAGWAETCELAIAAAAMLGGAVHARRLYLSLEECPPPEKSGQADD